MREAQALVGEARAALDAGFGAWPLDGVYEIGPLLGMAERPGTRLDGAELRRVADTLDVAVRLRRHLLGRAEAMPRIAALASGLGGHDALVRAVRLVVDEKGELLEDASPLLRTLRRQMARQREALLTKLEALMRDASATSDPYVTLRGDRYVIPVRTDAASSVRGIVHDRSQSGSTLFVEPLVAVDANNELQRLRDAESREVQRILEELTARVGEEAAAARSTVSRLAELDALHARAELSRRLHAAAPRIADGLSLRGARHPLLELQLEAAGKTAVPLDVEMGGARVLVVTGPNTGGKTVALKTVGLLALMHQAGLHVPADPDSELPVFERIVADIGDEQSIESAASTFSSHLRHVAEAVRVAGPGTLALLDELMSGTDPEEGAALAKVVLRRLAASGGATLVTTHLGELKLFAHAEPGLANAGMAFDPESRTPLFRLQPGVPGSSNAFAIAEKLGLAPSLLDEARRERGEAAGQLEDTLVSLERERARLQESNRVAEATSAEARRVREEHAQLLAELTALRRNLKAEARQEASRMLADAKVRLERVVRELREAQASRESIQAAHRTLREIEQSIGAAEPLVGQGSVTPAGSPAGNPDVDLEPGAQVWVAPLGREGTLEEISQDGKVRVRVGNVAVSLHVDDIRVLGASVEKPDRGGYAAPALEPVETRLDLRGLEREEALSAVDRFLDRMLRQGAPSAVIVHGKGTGVLRRSIHEHLSQHPEVAGFRLGEHTEGGSGATIVQLR